MLRRGATTRLLEGATGTDWTWELVVNHDSLELMNKTRGFHVAADNVYAQVWELSGQLGPAPTCHAERIADDGSWGVS